jgi:site-specific DNA recombinase
MIHPLDPPLTPRDGLVLRILAVLRISGPNQDPKSLEDQLAMLRRYVADRYDGPTDWTIISSTQSGELLDVKELLAIDHHLTSGRHDVLLTEDLGRVARRNRVVEICETAEDHGVRVIAKNDDVDTDRGDWRPTAMFAAVRHEQYNKDTAARIRRTLRNRFATRGLIQTVPYGYIKPPGVKTDDGVEKDPAAVPIYEEWFRRLEDGASFSEIVDFLNERGISPGPSTRSGRWSVHLVRGTTYNPILKGIRVRNEKISQRVNKTGRHRSVKAPLEERLERAVPHLAFIEASRYDRVVAMVRLRNATRGRKPVNGSDPRKGVPRKRTAWPGQHARCGVCGRLHYYGGYGRDGHLMCRGARDYRCWVGTTFPGALAAERIAAAVFAEVQSLPEFDGLLLDEMRRVMVAARATVETRLTDLSRQEQTLTRQIRSTTNLLVDAESSQALREKLRELESERDRVIVDRSELMEASGAAPSCRPPDEPGRARARSLALSADRRRQRRAARQIHGRAGGAAARVSRLEWPRGSVAPRPGGRPVRPASACGAPGPGSRADGSELATERDRPGVGDHPDGGAAYGDPGQEAGRSGPG